MTPSSSDHGRPVVAVMEEALPSIAGDTGQSVKVLPANGQGHDDERLAILEDLRDGATPIDLEFSLQRLLQPQLRGIEMPTPGVTAIAPPPSLHIRAQPRHQSQRSTTVKTNHNFSGIHRIHNLYGILVPAIRGAGLRAGYLGRASVSVISRAGRSTIVGVRKSGIVSGTAAQAAAKSFASGAAAAARLSSKGAAAAGRAVFGATVVAAAQPARFARLLRRIHMAAPLRAVLKPVRRATANTRTVAVIANQGNAVVPGTTTTVAKRTATEAPSVIMHQVSEPPVIRARSLTTHVKTEGLPGTASREGRLLRGAPYELATATAVPALLISDVRGTGQATGTATIAAAGQPTAKRRRKASTAGAAVVTPRRHLPAAAAAAAAALHVSARAANTMATGAMLAMKYAATATLCAFFPSTCRVLGIAAILAGPSLPLPPPFLLPPLPGLQQPRAWLQQPPPNPLVRGPLRKALTPLALIRGPFAVFATLRLVMPVVAPAVWRSVMYWQRTVPIVARYLLTSRRARALRSRGQVEAAEELWQRQHEWGAGALFDMLAELKGFYLKLGQILASKTDMLPQPYTESLSRLLDRLPPAPYRVVRRTITADLGVPPEVLFGELDPFPLASATIAQVHRGQLPDGRPVVVKVQHGPAHRMMRSDLANLSALSGLMEAAGLQLGFDHGSLVREYNVQVPLEFDFGREARVASAIRTSLESAAESYPALRRVVVPRMVPSHSGHRVLTMEYLDGVPILDIAGMDLAVRHALMTSLILAYGIMILRDGLFHSDPHPGNVLAMRRRRTAATTAAVAGGSGTGGLRATSFDAGGRIATVTDGNWLHPSYYSALYSPAPTSPSLVDMEDLQVALVDFGQSKQLSAASRSRYAMLVAAMAVRDDDLVLAVAGELGLVIDNCSDAFAAVAAYILFDTRMDFPEAHMGPMDPEAHEFRSAKVPSLPQDLFMIMRTITLLRGLLCSLKVDVSSAQLWRPLALQVLADLTPVYNGPAMGPMHDVIAPDTAAQLAADLAAVEPLDFGGSGGGVVLPSPSIAAAVVAAASLRGSSSRGSSRRGSSGGGGGGADRAATEAIRKQREAAAAAQRRMEREAAVAARREEANRRKQEEREAKAQRQRQMKEASEVRKVAERMEREARKRAEIEASNARRTVEREMVEARRKAERDAAAERRRSRSLTPEQISVSGSTAAKAMELKLKLTPSHSSPTSTASTVSPRLPPPLMPSAAAAAAARLAATPTPGVIHSPMPVRLAPFSGLVSLALDARRAQAGSGSGGNNGVVVSGMGGYGTGAAIGAFGVVDQDTAAAATDNLKERESVASPVNGIISPLGEPPSAFPPPPPGNFSSAGSRLGPILTPALTAPWARQPPPLPLPPPSTSTASTASSWISPVHLGSSPSTVQVGAGAADALPPNWRLDPDIGGAVGLSSNPGASIAPQDASAAAAAAAATATAAAATPAITAAAAGPNSEVDDLTARLAARAQQFANISNTPLMSHSSAVTPTLQSGTSAPQPLKLAQSEPPMSPPAAKVVGDSGATTGGSGTISKLSSNTTLQPQNISSSSQQLLPPHQQHQLQPQPAVISPRSSISHNPAQQQQQRLEKQLEQLQQQLQQLQQQQKQQLQQQRPTSTRLANVSPTPSALGRLPSSLSSSSAAAAGAVGATAPPPLSQMSAGSILRPAAAPPPESTAATNSEDIVAQARALLESTRKLVPTVSEPSTVPAANGKASAAARSSGGGGGGGIPGAIVVGGGHSAGGGGGSPVGGSNDQLISKRTDHTQSPPAMFLPPGRRQVGGGGGVTNPNLRRDVSPVAGGTAQNPISEIEPAPASLLNPQFQIQNQKLDATPSASEFAANAAAAVTAAAAAAAISGGGVDSRANGTPPESISAELLPTSTAAAAAAAAAVLTAGAAEGSVRGSGQLPSAGLAAATVGPSRTGEGMLPPSEEDYGMWLAQRQKMSQPGTEASVMQLQPQPRSQLQPSNLGVTPTSPALPTAAIPMVPPMAAAATAMAALHSPIVSTNGMAVGVTTASPASSVGSYTTAAGGALSGGGVKQRASGIESVKKGLSRIGRKIVNGLNP
ncbi:hypothetical protein VaNZ11_011328 [Volvox africanus]|uniref:ABC1 atypical kinase-like domain-containing protein n=1 Tax=Volvox africanus TaxID=51714 RepID=A0ABQ5SB47_9CHLO|nr:hypothetical protein VaNZ11_011328 [Volvox africanus]